MNSPFTSSERQSERDEMVRRQLVSRGVKNKLVIDAMKMVPRHWFVPAEHQAAAYDDRPLPIDGGQTISQPYIVAYMTEVLQLFHGKALEIGTGSGYQAAVLAAIGVSVYSIEIVKRLADQTRQIFDEHNLENIQTRCGDGAAGWPEAAPFDGILFTCATATIPDVLFEQLAVGGRLCAPIDVPGEDGQIIQLWHRVGRDEFKKENLVRVRFVPMTGSVEQSG